MHQANNVALLRKESFNSRGDGRGRPVLPPLLYRHLLCGKTVASAVRSSHRSDPVERRLGFRSNRDSVPVVYFPRPIFCRRTQQ